MNQRELIRLVAKKTNESALDVEYILEEMVSIMSEVLLEGDKVSLTRLGTFKLKTRKKRKGYDPYHGVVVEIPSRRKVIFESSKWMKDKLEYVEKE